MSATAYFLGFSTLANLNISFQHTCLSVMVRVVITKKLKGLFTLFCNKKKNTPKQAISGKMSNPCTLVQTKALMRWTSITNGINLIY
jgi:hypothetical protein